MDDILENLEKYNPNKQCKILIVFHDVVADMLNAKKRNPIETELFVRRRKLNTFLVFIIVLFCCTIKILD